MPKAKPAPLSKDLISKKIFKRLLQDMASSLLNLDLVEVELLETSRQRVEQRHADLVARVTETSGSKYILHIEVQNDNFPSMNARMLRYKLDIREDYPGLLVRQYLVYIGKSKFNMPVELHCYRLEYSYHVLDMHDIDCSELLDSNNPDALVLVILCDFGERAAQEVIERILLALRHIYRDDLVNLRDRLLALEVLATNRNLLPILKQSESEMLTVDIESLPSYQIGWEKGEAMGINKGEAIGISKGEAIGISKGEAIGISKGEARLVRALLRKQSPESVAELTGMELSRVLAIAADGQS